VPLAVSPVVGGLMFLLLFGPKGLVGPWFEAHGVKVAFALPGMTLATIFVSLPFVTRELVPVLVETGVEQEEAGATLGASRWQIFWRITLPQIKWGLIYGMTLTAARSLGEFGAVMVISGNIIRKTQTITLHVNQELADFHYQGAFSASVVLALFSFGAIMLVQHLYRHKAGER